MAHSGRSWNDPKSARNRAAGSSAARSENAPAGGSPPAAPGSTGGGRASWRDKQAPVVAQRGKERHWLVSRTENPNRMRYRLKLGIAAAALLLLVGFYVVYVFFGPQNTPLLLVGIYDYADPLPPNAWTREDFERFQATFTSDGAASGQNVRIYSDLGERLWKNAGDALAALSMKLQDPSMRPGGPGRDAVLIYLSGHGVLDADGRPCLLLATDHGGANVWQPQLSQLQQLPTVALEDVFDTVQKSYKEGVKKIVLLDCSRVQSNPRFGILENGFTAALKALPIHDENLFVLCSADEGQAGWTLPDRGASAFGYYVCKGLAGRADDAGNKDEIVTLDELEKYVRKQVSEQVQGRYLVDQTPILLTAQDAEKSAETTRLAWWRPESQSDEARGFAPPVPWEQVDALWSVHEKLKDSGNGRITESTRQWRKTFGLEADPPAFYRGADLLSWEAFQQGLLRLELLNDAGSEYADDARRLAGEVLKPLADELQRQADENHLSPSLALRKVITTPVVEQQVKRFIDGPVTDNDKEAFNKLLKEKYPPRAKAAWQRWLAWAQSRQAAAPADFTRTFALLPEQTGESGADDAVCEPVEISFLHLLSLPQYAPAELGQGEALALRSAILSRDLAETAAWANDDVRAHYAIERLVAQGDQARRQAEDHLFIQPSALNATGQVWDAAREPYRQALTLAVELSDALDLRDQAFQELPYLAQWLVLRQETDADRSAVTDEIHKCRDLLGQTKALADAIDRVMAKTIKSDAPADAETASRFAKELEADRQTLAQLRENMRRGLDEIVAFHRRAISDARLAAAPDVLNPRRIRDLLTTPLLTGDERRELRETVLTSRRNIQALQSKPADGEQQKPMALTDHPLLALFGETSTLANQADRLPGKIRSILQDRFRALQPTGDEPAAATKREDRLKLTAADRESRNFAVVWTLSPAYREPEKQLGDPLGTLAEFDLHHAVLWQARRALDDFWGNEGRGPEKWYFAALADLALREARRLGPGERSAAYDAVNDQLIERRQVARTWAEFNVPSVQLPPAGDRSGFVEVKPTIQIASGVPAGHAALFAEKEPIAMRPAETKDWHSRLDIAAAPLQKGLDAIDFQLPATKPTGDVQEYPLGLFYRGHVRPAKLVISVQKPGQQYVLNRTPPPPPRIMVKGTQGDTGAVSFIFDCSGSMQNAFHGVVPMTVAKTVLEQTLEELADAGTYRVSLWLYGHRLGWDDKKKKVVTRCEFLNVNPAQAGIPPRWCQPETMLMSEDVAREWPFDPNGTPKLTSQRYAEIQQLLGSVQGFGVTPLFYSIVKAVQEDPNLKVTTAPRRLIVLTDGLNNVNAYYQKPRKTYKPQDVVSAMGEDGRGVKLHVVGFGEVTAAAGDVETNPEAREWRKVLPTIGTYHEIRNLEESSFNELLRQLIGLQRYAVTQSGRVQAKPITERLNRQVVLSDNNGRQQYDVRVVGSRQAHELTLEGGEAIDLFVADAQSSNPRLVHQRYRTEMQASAMASNPDAAAANAEKFFVGFHQPQRLTGFTLFPISIQNDNEAEFSPRPAEAWIEITPVGAAPPDEVRPLVFYDLEFESGRPVPVLLCRAMNWPPEARRARIDLFFKMQRTDTALRFPVRDVEGRKETPELDLRLASGGKVQFTVSVSPAPEYNGARITVIERCAKLADLHQAKVEIETPANSVRRQSFHSADKHEVHHEFIYSGKVTDELMDYRLRITSREDLRRGAARLHEPVEVSVVNR
jgi:hypothetical protein